MLPSADSAFSPVEAAIRATGARATPARVRVLGLLRSAQRPLSHGHIERLLSKDALPEIDRVTLYRVLEWLGDVGLALKATDARGIFCFTAAKPDVEHARHMHFRCTVCGGVFCLDLEPPPPPELPEGFHVAGAEMDLRGECPDCAPRRSRPERPAPLPREA